MHRERAAPSTGQVTAADKRSTRAHLVALVALILLSLGLRLWRIEAKSIWWDESLSLYRAQSDVGYILSNRIDFPGASTVDLHPPLYFLLLHGFIRVVGASDLALRFPSVAFAALLVSLLYAMGTRLRSPRVGLWAAGLGALSPYYLWYGQEARMYTMATALALFSAYALWRAIDSHRWPWWLAFGASALAAAFTNYLAAVLIVAEAALAFFLWPRTDRNAPHHPPGQPRIPATRRRRWGLWIGGGLFALILGALAYRVAGMLPNLATGRSYVSPLIILRDALNSYSLGLSVDLDRVWPLDLAFAGAFLLGIVSLWRRPPRVGEASATAGRWPARGAGLAITLLPVLFLLVAIWLVSLFVPLYMGSRYMMVASPAFYLGVAVGLDALTGARDRTTVGRILLTTAVASALLGGMALSDYRYFGWQQYATKEDYRSAATTIRRNERVGDVIIVTAPENVVAFTHYYDGHLPVVGLPSVALSGNPDPDGIAQDLSRLAAGHDRLWLVHCRTMFSDPADLVTRWLDENRLLLERRVFPSYGSDVTLSAYLGGAPRVEESGPSADPLGDYQGQMAIQEVVARYWTAGGDPVERRAHVGAAAARTLAPVPEGELIAVDFFLLPLQPLSNYKVSLRLVDDRGVVWAQRDRSPYDYWPTSEWSVGQLVRYCADVPVPLGTPPGVYRLQAWLYEAETGRSLPFDDQTGGARNAYCGLGAIAVEAAPGRAQLYASRKTEGFPPPAVRRTPRGLRFGTSLELLGYDYAPQSVRPGQEVELRFYWRAAEVPPSDYRLVINWRDQNGKVWHTATHSPTGTPFDTSQWAQGQMVRGIVRTTVPETAPPGTHSLHILVFDPIVEKFLWLRRGPLPWPSHDLRLGDIEIR